jgi:predicted  nucleic acid-binding Zn-ribbon protein
MSYENLDLDAYDRFLLHALRQAGSTTQQRALRLLGHDVDDNERLNYASQRIEALAREAQHEQQRADSAQDSLEQYRQLSVTAEERAQKHAKRADAYASHLHGLYQQLSEKPTKMALPQTLRVMADEIHELLADYDDEPKPL